MIIGYDASRANKPKRTGTEWYSYQLLAHMLKQDREHSYRLYTREPLGKGLRKVADSAGNAAETILSWPPRYLWTQLRLSWEMLRRAPDVLLVTAHALPLLHPKKSVTTIHDIGFVRYPELYDWKDRLYHRFVVWYAARRSALILTVSRFTKDELVSKYGLPAGKIRVTHLGYDCGLYRQIDDTKEIAAAKKRHGVASPYLLYVGRLEKKKNILRLAKAFHGMKRHPDLADWKLVLVGKKRNAWPEAQAFLRKRGLLADVVTPGWVDTPDIPRLIAGAEFFVLPSLYEGFGLPVIEAMACGTPVAASRVASLPEVAGDAALLFNPYDVEDMREALTRLATDRDLADELRRAGLERCQAFTWESCAQATLAALDELGSKG